MKILGFLLAFITTSLVNAQNYQPIITPSKQFTVWWDEDGPGFYTTRHYWFEGDTTISGQNYKKLLFDNIHNPFDNPTVCSLLREDTAAQKVYRIINIIGDSILSKTEHLLYDYNLQPGDSLYSLTNFYQWEWKKITSIDSITLLTGKVIRQWHTDEADYFGNTVLFSEYVPFGQSQPDIVAYLAPRLQCAFEENGIKLFGDSWCDNKYIGVEDVQLKHAVLDIYPNPAHEFITIEPHGRTGELLIYNTLGQVVLKAHISRERETIALVDLRNGIYVVTLQHDGFIYTQKLIIE